MGRILLSVPNEKPWSYGGHLETALRELGHDAYVPANYEVQSAVQAPAGASDREPGSRMMGASNP